MQEVTIVTAFFDINRSEMKGFNRSNQKYFEYFKFWSGLKNNLVVYTDKTMAQQVIDWRTSLGLKQQTEVIVLDDIYQLEGDIYQAMLQVEQNPDFINFRLDTNAIENKANYNYVMLMKYWCLNDAGQRGLLKTPMTAWVDFGFNHGGSVYTKSEEFDFLWKTELDSSKIHLFANDKYQQSAVIKQVQYLSQNVQGPILIMGSETVGQFYQTIKQAVQSLLNLDLNDDDQTWLLMASKIRPNLVVVHQSDWFLPLKEHGAEFLTAKLKTPSADGLVMRWRKAFYEFRRKRRFLRQLAREYDKIFKLEQR